MGRVLRLDLSGTPTSWLSCEDAAVLYVKDLVKWELGKKNLILLGGFNRISGEQSFLEISPVIATKGDIHHRRRTAGFNNQMLFRRDNYRCMYCGTQHTHAELTRDHVIPRSKGGPDIWENVVAACRRCNQFKADRTPEAAGMALLAVPFRPNVFESMFLAQHTVLADQMEYLEKQFTGNRDWKAA
ncbi:HNH endonuclease [Zooshikella ganghwensis]|uniref:HNH endonuclease n=1 Tax=Zooshikella ganghwensis TaxID=202772 RepID=UPI001F17D90F|nr:HNH endonuclease [Zooshikella ganghwensis]